MKALVLFSFVIFSSMDVWVFAAPKTQQKALQKTAFDDSKLRAVEKKYASAASVRMKVKRTLLLSVLKKTREYSGVLTLKKPGMLRLELEGQQKSLIVMDGKTIWVVEYPETEAEGGPKVLISNKSNQLKSQALLSFLLGKGKILTHFKVIERIKPTLSNPSEVTYLLLPNENENEIRNLSITIDEQKNLITSISFWDSLNNESRLSFSDTEFSQKIDPTAFKFTVPKNAEVTRLD
jgi:outer membrane lipoprotein-sorting protein